MGDYSVPGALSTAGYRDFAIYILQPRSYSLPVTSFFAAAYYYAFFYSNEARLRAR